jgi:hypothetical protein
MIDKLLNLEDIKVGMKVNTMQLINIYDTYVLLGDLHYYDNGKIEGTIVAISKEKNKHLLDVSNMCKEKYGEGPFIHIQRSSNKTGWYDV